MSNDIDALVYSEISPIITDLKEWKKYTGSGGPIQKHKQILAQTTLKRLCCQAKVDSENSNNFVIKVRIPLFKEVKADGTFGSDIAANTLPGEKFKFYEKEISVPKTLCNTNKLKKYTSNRNKTSGGNENNWVGTDACDDFYHVYCKNSLKEFKELIGDRYEKEDGQQLFIDYKPECACFGDWPKFVKQMPVNAQKTAMGVYHCMEPLCITKDDAYRPKESANDCKVDMQICQQNVQAQLDAGDIKDASGNKITAAEATMNCVKGESMPTPPAQPTPAKPTPQQPTPAKPTPQQLTPQQPTPTQQPTPQQPTPQPTPVKPTAQQPIQQPTPSGQQPTPSGQQPAVAQGTPMWIIVVPIVIIILLIVFYFLFF